jgi:hydroxyacylglutathione hydrolase
MLLFKFPSGPLSTNAILFGDGGVGAVIDPAQGSTEKILAQASKSGLTIEKILLTHSHWDHIVDLQAIQSETGAFVYVHKLDAGNVKAPGSDGIPLFFPILPVKPDHFLEEGQVIKVGSLELKVIHTPGHSPGGVCFYLASQKILFAGDTLFKGTYGRLDSPTGDEESMRQSLGKLAKLPPNTHVISGHGPDTEIGKESWLAKVDLI